MWVRGSNSPLHKRRDPKSPLIWSIVLPDTCRGKKLWLARRRKDNLTPPNRIDLCPTPSRKRGEDLKHFLLIFHTRRQLLLDRSSYVLHAQPETVVIKHRSNCDVLITRQWLNWWHLRACLHIPFINRIKLIVLITLALVKQLGLGNKRFRNACWMNPRRLSSI